MNLIGNLTDSPNQKIVVQLDNGEQVSITFKYFEGQAGWFYSFTYNSVVVNNRRLVASPNMLRQFRGVLPFGLACFVEDGGEPVKIDDFTTGRVKFYSLNANDVISVESFIVPYAQV